MKIVNLRLHDELLTQIDQQLEKMNDPELIRAMTLANKGIPVSKTSRNEFLKMLLIVGLDVFQQKSGKEGIINESKN